MLKVAIIIERAEIGLGGAERSVSELTAELRRQGVDATILAAKGTPAENTQILCGDYAKKRVPLKVFENALRVHLENNAYDIVHSTLPLTIADIYQPRGGSYREALDQHIASYPCWCLRYFKQKFHWLNLKRTQYLNAEKDVCAPGNRIVVAALSNYVKKQFKEHYRLPDDRIRVIPNGINTQQQPDEKAAGQIKKTILKSISIPPGKEPVLFLFAANNPRLKGLRELLEAFEMASHATTHPILITVGSKGLGPYEGLSKKLDLRNRLVSLGHQDNISNVLSICDIAVLPSYYDPCSRFILEALAMGKPVITTEYNGASEFFTHKVHGITVPSPEFIFLLQPIEYFCNRDKIAVASKAIVDDNLKDDVSIQKHVKKLIGLYNQIIKKRKIV